MSPLSRRAELEQCKRDINLSEYAAFTGYTLDRQLSSDNYAVMRSARGDKIIITKASKTPQILSNHSSCRSPIRIVP